MSSATFDWRRTKQLGFMQLLVATFGPSLVGVFGFHFILPTLVSGGLPVLIAWPAVASVMLFLFSFVAFYLLKREARELSISLWQRMCLVKLNAKAWVVATLVIVLGVMVMSAIQPLLPDLWHAIGFTIPEYMPFFLRGIDPAVVTDPNLISPGLELKGAYGLLPLLAVTLLLNIVVEEFYFRAWMLPKLSRYGRLSWVINGVMFAFYHLFQWWLLPVILVGSLVFAFVVYYSKSVYPALLFHFVLNFLFAILGIIALIMGAG